MKNRCLTCMGLVLCVVFLNPIAALAAGPVKTKPAETTEIEVPASAKECYRTVRSLLEKLEYEIQSKKKKKFVSATKTEGTITSLVISTDGSGPVAKSGTLYTTTTNIWLVEQNKKTTAVSVYVEVEEFKLDYPNKPASVKKERKLDVEKEIVEKLKGMLKTA